MDFLNPTQAAPADPQKSQDLNKQWKGWASDPKAQAFLINTGLQLMMPSWYGSGTAIAQAVGKGLEGAAGIEKLQLAEQEKASGAGSGRAEKDADREDRQAHDLALEELRQKGRSDLLGSKNGPDDSGYTKEERAQFDKIYRQTESALRGQNKSALTPEDRIDDEAITEAATNAAAAAVASRRRQFGKPTSANPGAAAAPVGQEGATQTPNPISPISPNEAHRSSLSGKTPGRSAAAPVKKPLPAAIASDPAINDPGYRAFLKSKGYDID